MLRNPTVFHLMCSVKPVRSKAVLLTGHRPDDKRVEDATDESVRGKKKKNLGRRWKWPFCGSKNWRLMMSNLKHAKFRNLKLLLFKVRYTANIWRADVFRSLANALNESMGSDSIVKNIESGGKSICVSFCFFFCGGRGGRLDERVKCLSKAKTRLNESLLNCWN